jgi:hypothetical protein
MLQYSLHLLKAVMDARHEMPSEKIFYNHWALTQVISVSRVLACICNILGHIRQGAEFTSPANIWHLVNSSLMFIQYFNLSYIRDMGLLGTRIGPRMECP